MIIITTVCFISFLASAIFLYKKIWLEMKADLKSGEIQSDIIPIAFIICFTPINIVVVVASIFMSIFIKMRDKIKKWIKIITNKINEKKRLKYYEKYKDIDPFGEENWDE